MNLRYSIVVVVIMVVSLLETGCVTDMVDTGNAASGVIKESVGGTDIIQRKDVVIAKPLK